MPRDWGLDFKTHPQTTGRAKTKTVSSCLPLHPLKAPRRFLPMRVVTCARDAVFLCADSICHGLGVRSVRRLAVRPARWGAVAAMTWAMLVATVATAQPCRDRPQDEVWLVSSRPVGCVQSGEMPPLIAQRYTSDGGWESAQVDELYHPSTPDQIVVVYVHGNRVSSCEAVTEGHYVYHLLTSHVDDPVSLRFVIWSWPSDQVQGQLRDVRIKAARTNLAGYCLGWFLAHLPEDQRVSLLGYSFGARITTGSLHLVGGGRLAGRMLPDHGGGAPQRAWCCWRQP